jgi:hypothetical protein
MFETLPECASPLEPPVRPTIQFVPYAIPETSAAPIRAARKRRLRDDRSSFSAVLLLHIFWIPSELR